MALDIACPICGETEDLSGRRLDEHIEDEHIEIVCGNCGQRWQRPTTPTCARCGGTDLQPVPFAIVERSRGTQLSVVGIRIIHLCTSCDEESIARWQRNRPNPLLPDQLPKASGDETS